MQELWSINRLSVELQRDRRALGKALEGLPPDYERSPTTNVPAQEEFFGEPGGDPQENNPRRLIKLWKLHRVIAHLYESQKIGLDFTDERARLAKAQADRIEMENAVRRGELASLDVVELEWASMITSMRAQLLAMPSKLAPRLAAKSMPQQIESIVREELYRIMSAIADGADVDAIETTGESNEIEEAKADQETKNEPAIEVAMPRSDQDTSRCGERTGSEYSDASQGTGAASTRRTSGHAKTISGNKRKTRRQGSAQD